MTITTNILQSWWILATKLGMRRLASLMKRWYPSAYGQTVFYWERVEGYVALTIDDGLCRDPSGSMVKEVRELLRSYGARATFFVCTNYMAQQDALSLLDDGHELGNHLLEDRSGYYCNLSKDDFRTGFLDANRMLQDITKAPPRWFRAPQGRMTKIMSQVVNEAGMTHVLGDCYCDDWAFAQAGDARAVAPLMLSQVQSGSIAIFHMPERGFREASLDALRTFLEGTKERSLQCVTLTEMEDKDRWE